MTLRIALLVLAAYAGIALKAPAPAFSETPLPVATELRIQRIFDSIGAVGNAYNAGGGSAAGSAALDMACQTGAQSFSSSGIFSDIFSGTSERQELQGAYAYLRGKGGQLEQHTLTLLCAALSGEQLPQIDLSGLLQDTIRNDLAPRLVQYGENFARQSGLPFLGRLEVETGAAQGSLVGSVTAIQPLWRDAQENQHIFTQVSWYKAPTDKDSEGFRTQQDTLNAGLAYRYLTPDKKALYGANIFLDHAPVKNHNRISLGVDARTSQLAASANRYIPLSAPKGLNLYYEERPAAGWDLELRGQTPEFPDWTFSALGYEWDGQDDGKNLYGLVAAMEYSPFPALIFRLGFRDESQAAPSLESGVRFVWRFDQPQDLQWRPRTELAAVDDYVYEKVHRNNIIRVEKRRKASSKLTVVETAGVNSATEATGASALTAGKILLMPVTVSVANTVGAVARLRFSDGAILTAGQNTQVLIEPDLITLISGTIQYVSGAIVRNVAVPGGTIVLHGTDIDVVSGGGSSSVRVRDGSVTYTGSVSGVVTLGAEDMGVSTAGVVSAVALGAPAYTAHTDQVSTEIDRIATPLTGAKVSPYSYEAPQITSENLTPGQVMEIGLKFNYPVTVSGGTPQLLLTIGGNNRTAPLIAGSGTDQLIFGYTVQAGDNGETALTVTGFDNNGAAITGNGKEAITTIAGATLTFSGAVADVTAPAGYGVTFTTTPVFSGNETAVDFDITTAEVGSTYNYSITSSGGGAPITGSGTISGATESITGIDVSGLTDGTLTVSVTLTDLSANAGAAVTDTATKDTAAPYVVSVTAPANGTYQP